MPVRIKADPRNIYVGIDPGASGALAVLDDGGELVGCFRCSGKTSGEIYGAVVDATDSNGAVFGVIEKVGGHIGRPQPGAAMFKFGFNAGLWTMALVAAEVPFEEVTPQVWQKGLKIPAKGRDEKGGAWKNRLKAKAQQLFPSHRVTLDDADAILIAEYCRRKRTGTL